MATFWLIVCDCALTCSEETIDVHSLLLSISPYSRHGLEIREGKVAGENDTCTQHHLVDKHAMCICDVVILSIEAWIPEFDWQLSHQTKQKKPQMQRHKCWFEQNEKHPECVSACKTEETTNKVAWFLWVCVSYLYVIGRVPVNIIQHQVGSTHQIKPHPTCFGA